MNTRQHSKSLVSANLDDQTESLATPVVQPSLSIREHGTDDGRSCRANSPHGERHAATSLATASNPTVLASDDDDDDVATATRPTADAEAGAQHLVPIRLGGVVIETSDSGKSQRYSLRL